jgi:hypothetical protein
LRTTVRCMDRTLAEGGPGSSRGIRRNEIDRSPVLEQVLGEVTLLP